MLNCFIVWKTAAETLFEAYGDDALSKTTSKWLKRFKNGKTSMNDDEWSG
jgi:hypothetical protein